VDHVRSDLISRGPVLVKDDPLVENLTEKVAVMTGLVEEARAPIKVLPPRLKNLQDYLGQVANESNQWKDLHASRKNRMVIVSNHVLYITKKLIIKKEYHQN